MWLLRHELTEAFVQGVRLERDISSRFLSLSYTCTLFTLRADRFWEDCFVFFRKSGCWSSTEKGLSWECVFVPGLGSLKIEWECGMGFHTCNYIVLTYYNSSAADPGSHAAVVPKYTVNVTDRAPSPRHIHKYWHTYQSSPHGEQCLWWITDWPGWKIQ